MATKLMTLVVVALVASLAMAGAAWATEVTISSPTGGDTGGQYTAWKLLEATPDPTADPETYTYKINAKYKDALQTVTGKTTDADVYAYIKALGTDDAAAVQAFATAMYAQVKGMDGDATLTTGTAATLANGYWLIAETTIGEMEDGSDGVATRLLLDTAGTDALNITAKESYPTPDKKITNVNNNGQVKDDDSATAEIGDIVTFELSATLPANFAAYNNGYTLKFEDTLSAGLDFVAWGDFKIDGQAATPDVKTVSGKTLNVGWTDISTDSNAAAGKVVTVTYTARVNASASTGITGNDNKVKIEFSNDPNNAGTGKSKDKEVKVYTFKLDVVKHNENDEPLAGAGFVLKNADGKYYKFTAAEGENPATVTWVDALTDATEYTSNGTDGKLSGDFTGLPEGTYTLVENTVPASYNKVNDITFTVGAAAVDADDSITVTLTATDNEVTADANYDFHSTVVNQKGVELPSTGGIGTTILYIIGAVLVIGAGVFLVTKRRMRKEDNVQE